MSDDQPPDGDKHDPGGAAGDDPESVTPKRGTSRAKRAVGAAYSRGSAVADRGQLWIENQDPASRTGATVGWWRRYQAADGQLYAVLLSAYFFLTILPVTLVEASYVYSNPDALANHAVHRLGLTGTTADRCG